MLCCGAWRRDSPQAGHLRHRVASTPSVPAEAHGCAHTRELQFGFTEPWGAAIPQAHEAAS